MVVRPSNLYNGNSNADDKSISKLEQLPSANPIYIYIYYQKTVITELTLGSMAVGDFLYSSEVIHYKKLWDIKILQHSESQYWP